VYNGAGKVAPSSLEPYNMLVRVAQDLKILMCCFHSDALVDAISSYIVTTNLLSNCITISCSLIVLTLEGVIYYGTKF